jgi:eukaryotic-like serine/threonine-protein kinase
MSGELKPSGGFDPAVGDLPSPGQVIAAKYEVEHVLGVGGMGVVVAARHLHLGQQVAIKFIRADAARDANAVSRFLREARAAVALSSEHVTKVLDVGTFDSGAPYMVMEYLNGIDVAEMLHRNGPMSVAEALNVVLQACEAIAEAHARGIVHRDLKPSNLFVTQHVDGTPLVKVLDFGISKMAAFNSPDAGGGTLTASGSVMGSPMYMSPEQVRNAKAVDARSDIWALGIVLYELFTGKTPFAGATLGDTLARIIADPPPPIGDVRPELPEGLQTVIMQCLERRIERRIQTVGELAARLLPFAPREAELLVQRITRLSRGGSSETMTVMPATPGPELDPPSPTQPSWHRSDTATSHPSGLPRKGSTKLVAACAGAAVVVAIGAAAIYAGNRGRAGPSPSAASSAAIGARTSESVVTTATATPTHSMPTNSIPSVPAAAKAEGNEDPIGAAAEQGQPREAGAASPAHTNAAHKSSAASSTTSHPANAAPPGSASAVKKTHYEDF